MTRPRWLVVVVLSAATYAGCTILYRYLAHHRVPSWTDIPFILASWAFFALGYFGVEWLARRRRRDQVTG